MNGYHLASAMGGLCPVTYRVKIRSVNEKDEIATKEKSMQQMQKRD